MSQAENCRNADKPESEPIMWRCFECGIELGDSNPRQFCGKTHCHNPPPSPPPLVRANNIQNPDIRGSYTESMMSGNTTQEYTQDPVDHIESETELRIAARFGSEDDQRLISIVTDLEQKINAMTNSVATMVVHINTMDVELRLLRQIIARRN